MSVLKAVRADYDRWKEWRQCGRKKGRWQTQRDANLAALKAWKNGLWMWPYDCHYCGGWHLSKQRDESTTQGRGADGT